MGLKPLVKVLDQDVFGITAEDHAGCVAQISEAMRTIKEYCAKARELLRELCPSGRCHPDPATTVAIKLFNMFCG